MADLEIETIRMAYRLALSGAYETAADIEHELMTCGWREARRLLDEPIRVKLNGLCARPA